MSVRNILMAAAGSSGSDKLYVDDVFSAYTYAGNGSTQTINNGIDLAGEGGLVWLKSRDLANEQMLYDTIRGGNQYLSTNTTSAQIDRTPSITSWNQNGFSVAGNDGSISYPGYNYISWTFRKAPKFFDVVTYTGNGANRTIPHALGQEVGMMLVKRTNSVADWQVYHRSLANTEYMVLNSTAAKATGATRWNSTTATTSNISLGTDATVNASGGAYVAYLFAHDPSADGVVQCGSFTTDGSGKAMVNLGWEPQFSIFKTTQVSEFWRMDDVMRGNPVIGQSGNQLRANSSGAEYSALEQLNPTATGFEIDFVSAGPYANKTFIYLAIRRPNKPPTTGTQVYNAIARTGTGADATVTGVGFAPDAVIASARASGYAKNFMDRLRGRPVLEATSTAAEVTPSASNDLVAWDMDGVSVGGQASTPINAAVLTVDHFFKRAPGFFDVVCYKSSGSVMSVTHSLVMAPELMIIKDRAAANGWAVYHKDVGNTKYLTLNATTTPATLSSVWNNTSPTNTVFTVGTAGVTGSTGLHDYVAYLFATLPGISKVGSYTGNGASQTINCGFSAGARFVLIKRTDSTGDWYVWDSVRGIVSANDPHLSLNTTAAEVTTDDSVDPDVSGFIVNQVAATNINVSGGQYIFLAIA